jgi:purine-nucleoside phosphorylase
MSTIPENIVAVHMGIETLAFSVITDECFPDALKPVSVKEIVATANEAEPRLTLLMREVIGRI